MLGSKRPEAPDERKHVKTYVCVPKQRPAESKAFDRFTSGEALPRTTFHQVHKVTEKSETELRTYFLKENPPGSPISELEAVAASFYKLIAPSYIPATYAVYDKNNSYIGVVSEEFPDFKSTLNDPLTDDDLQTDFIETKKLSIDLLDKLSETLQQLEGKADSASRRSQKLEETESKLQLKMKQLKKEVTSDRTHFESLIKEFEANTLEKIIAFKESCHIAQLIIDFYKQIKDEYNITKKEFENYRIVKGLAVCLTTSYIFMEDDLHQNNLSKFGKRIDFDMSLWPMLYDFKDSKLILFRKPTTESFRVTSHDITHFPNLKDAKPFYWPTNPAHALSDSFNATVKTFFHMSTNSYPHQINILYQKLAKNSVFIHHKYATFAAYILTYGEMYAHLASLHLRKELVYNSQSFIDFLTKQQADRITEFENILINIPDFQKFFKENSEKLAEKFIKSYQIQDLTFKDEKIEKARNDILELIELAQEKLSKKATEDTQKPKTTVMEVKPTPICSYDAIKSIIIKSMGEYKGGGILSAYGMFRNHGAVAKEITDFCESLKPDPNDKAANIDALIKVKTKISERLASIPSGGFHAELLTLLTIADKTLKEHTTLSSVPMPVASLAPSPTS